MTQTSRRNDVLIRVLPRAAVLALAAVAVVLVFAAARAQPSVAVPQGAKAQAPLAVGEVHDRH